MPCLPPRRRQRASPLSVILSRTARTPLVALDSTGRINYWQSARRWIARWPDLRTGKSGMADPSFNGLRIWEAASSGAPNVGPTADSLEGLAAELGRHET